MIYNKTSKVIISIILLSLFSLNSCSFFLEKEIKEQSSHTVSDSSSNMLKLCVTPSFGDSTQENIRSAYPNFSTQLSELHFTVSCSEFSETPGSYSSGVITFEINCLTFSEAKEITLYAKDSYDNILMTATTSIIYTTLGDTVTAKADFQKNIESDVKGFIQNLKFLITTGYYCSVEVYNGNELVSGDEDDGKQIIVTSSSNSYTLNTATGGIAPGAYTAKVKVYRTGDTQNVIRDYIIQTINVWPGLTTSVWYLNNGTSNSNEYSISISADKVKYYVLGSNPTGIYADPEFAEVTASSTNSGSIMHPLDTLQNAINKCTSSTTEYRIIVSGKITGTTTIGTSIPENANIIIEGASETNGDILDGGSNSNTLKISQKINLTLKKITITKGGSTNYGGGIYVSGGATVNLENGTLVTENTASYMGGGIYIYGTGSNVKIYEGAEVSSNYISATNNNGSTYGGGGVYISSGSSLTLEGGIISDHDLGYNQRGAGVFVNGGTLTINSGKITANKATDIAANVMLDNGAALIMNDGEISYGTINGIGDASAAGVWINQNSCSMEMHGGKICNNKAIPANESTAHGAGITVWGGTSSFKMNGGIIENNSIEKKNSTDSIIIQGGAVYSGGIFEIEGESYIPYGVEGTEGTGLNDIWVSNNKKITITGKLTNPASSTNGIIANITPQVYSNGTPILAISSSPNPSTTLPAESVKFNIVPDVSNPNKNWVINSTGELVLPFRIIVNDSDLYLDKSSFVTAISNSSLTNQNVKIQILEMDADDFGPVGTTGTVLYAIKNSPATKISLIVDEDANIKLPAISKQYFSGISNVVEMDLRGLDTSNVTSMYAMFYICNNLESLNLSSFNTSKVETMQTFLYSNKIKSLDLSSFDTSNVTNMEQMIAMCSNITSLDISNFNTSKVTNTKQMFFADGSLKTIYVSSDFVVDEVTESGNMFQNCSSLTGGKGTTTSGNPINASYARIDNPPDNPGYFTQGPVKKENLVSYITSMTESGTVFLPSNTDAAVIEDVKGALQTLLTNKPDVEVDLDLRLIRLTEIPASAFSGCGNIASIHLPSTINSFGSSAFSSCSKLKNVYVEEMKVDDWANINFANYSANPCNNGADLYLRGTKVQYAFFDTATKINAYAFYGCTSIDSFELPVELKEIGNSAFAKCPNLTNVSDMTAVTTFGNSIFDSSGMNFTSLSTSQITEIPTEMFYRCNSLTSVNLGSGITKLGEAAFGYCNNLASITIPNTVTSIGKNQFLYSPKDIDIYYDGTQTQWNSIVESNWNYGHNNMKKITVHFNDGTTNDTY